MTRDAIPWTPEGAPASYNPYATTAHMQTNIPFGGTAHLIPAQQFGGAGQQRVPPPHLQRDPRALQAQMANYHAQQQQQQQQPHPQPPQPPLQHHHGVMPPGMPPAPAEYETAAMKGSVLDKRRKQQASAGANISASAGYAKKMAEMAAAQYNAQRATAAAAEEDGVQDPLTGEVSPRVPQVCNEAYNLNPILRENILASEYFKTLAEITTFEDLLDEIYNKVTYATPFIPNTRSPSSCFCLLYRCFQMRLTYKQLATMLDHPDSPLIPAVGLLYVRYVVDPKEAWGFYKPKEIIEEIHYYDTILPRIPVMIQRTMQENILRLEHEKKELADKRRKIRIGQKVKALFYDDEQTYDAEIVAETKLGFKVVFTEYGNDQDTEVADITIPERSDREGDDRKRESGRERSKERGEKRDRDRDRDRDAPRDYRESRDKDRERERSRSRSRDRGGARDKDRRRSRSRSRGRKEKEAAPIDFREQVLLKQADKAASKGGDYAKRPTSYKSSLSSCSNRRC